MEPPLQPDAETAREWAVTELADPVYHRRPTLLQRAFEWVADVVVDAFEAASGVDVRIAALVLLGVVVTVVVVSLVVAGPVRRARAARRGSADPFEDDTRTASELRRSADALAAQGRWAEAVLDRFRALLRSLEERAVLDERPGRTAHEAAEESGRRLPEHEADLHRAGRLFDDVCYGKAAAGPDDDVWLRSLDARVAGTRPASRTEPLAGATAGDR